MKKHLLCSQFLICLCGILVFSLLWAVPAGAVEYDWDAYEAQVAQILDETIISGMSDEQLALYIHDQLIVRYRYNLEGSNPDTIHSAYGLLVDGAAVCDGYAEAYEDLMTRVGIPCVIVSSDAMNHAWNLVQIDGEWYHVDVTWDDPARKYEDVHGYVLHKYFMMSDAKARETGHRNWTQKYECTSTKYDTGAYWENVESQFCFVSSDISYHLEYDRVDGPGFIGKIQARVVRRDHAAATEENITSQLRDVVVASVYSEVMGISYWDGALYIGDNAVLFGVCPVTGETWPVYTHDPNATQSRAQAIHGCYVRDGAAYITTRDIFEIRDNYQTSLQSSGHTTTVQVIASTCQTEGHTQLHCSCGQHVSLACKPAADHSYGDGTVTLEPTYDQPGIREYTCLWCGTQKQEALPSLKDAGCQFDDVAEDRFYYESVIWACCEGITKGTSETQFSPDKTCTRGEVVTFLWRASGSPEPVSTTGSFTDVKSGAFYEKAVAWAVEKGITNGTSATTFAPSAPCTRAQVATFLWRTAEQPQAPQVNPFQDAVPGSFYYDAVLWAVSEGITNGTAPDTFSPGSPCSRGQIVTFLYRYLGQ